MLGAGSVDQQPPARNAAAGGDLRTRHQRDAEPAHLVVEQDEQGGAMDGEAEHAAAQARRTRRRRCACRSRLTLDAGDHLAVRDGTTVEPEPSQAGKPRRLQQEAGAHRLRRGEAFKQGDSMAVAGEKGGGRQTRGARARHGDMEGRHQCPLLPDARRCIEAGPPRPGNAARSPAASRDAPLSTSASWAGCS